MLPSQFRNDAERIESGRVVDVALQMDGHQIAAPLRVAQFGGKRCRGDGRLAAGRLSPCRPSNASLIVLGRFVNRAHRDQSIDRRPGKKHIFPRDLAARAGAEQV